MGRAPELRCQSGILTPPIKVDMTHLENLDHFQYLPFAVVLQLPLFPSLLGHHVFVMSLSGVTATTEVTIDMCNVFQEAVHAATHQEPRPPKGSRDDKTSTFSRRRKAKQAIWRTLLLRYSPTPILRASAKMLLTPRTKTTATGRWPPASTDVSTPHAFYGL